MVRDRAARLGPELLLFDRAFDDVMERLAAISRPPDDVLLVGCPSREWLVQLQRRFRSVRVVELGPIFADAAGVRPESEIEASIDEGEFDIAIAIGTLDTVNQLPLALRQIIRSLRPGSPLFGAMTGGNSLPALRSALIEAERVEGAIAQRVHPRIDAPTLAGLMAHAGFQQPVVDIDRVRLRYPSMSSLIRDLRAMGATSQLASVTPLTRAAAARAAAAFEGTATDGKTAETVEILHFTGWAP